MVWRIDSKSELVIAYPSCTFATCNDRVVVYEIEEKKMTIEQLWQYGEEAGFNTDAFTSAPNPYMREFNWGKTELLVEMRVESTKGYSQGFRGVAPLPKS